MEKYETKAVPVLFSHTDLSVDTLYFPGRLMGKVHVLVCSKFENNSNTYHHFKTIHVPGMYLPAMLQQPEGLYPC
jgi:hypothetical protein